LYLVIFHALLPLYRRHRARYSQYLPLQPSSLRDRLSTLFVRLFVPSTWSFRGRFAGGQARRDSVLSADGELFDAESGEAMVGFDVQDRSRRRDGMDRQVSNMNAATRTVSGARIPPRRVVESDRRLSRELEEGFRDDSEDDEPDEHQVVAGTRNSSVRR
jgi:hypothetical protein